MNNSPGDAIHAGFRRTSPPEMVQSSVYVIEPMTEADIEEVSRVEAKCFTNPWPVSAYQRELKRPDHNYYIVLRDDPDSDAHDTSPTSDSDADFDWSVNVRSRRPRRFVLWPFGRRNGTISKPPIIGFAGMWNMLDESHVTTIGVLPEYRGRGLGEVLFITMMEEAKRRNVTWVTLEVRVTNHSAQNLYRKYGFTIQGRRPRYYSDNNEDAFIMWSESIKNETYLTRLEQLKRQLVHRMSFDDQTHTPTTTAGEPG
jgi:ribosomal-protein-alanine N-acetyltransferase